MQRPCSATEGLLLKNEVTTDAAIIDVLLTIRHRDSFYEANNEWHIRTMSNMSLGATVSYWDNWPSI